LSTVNTFLIGADPEFIALDKNGSHVNVKPYTTKEAEVAWDHDGDVLEVKPRPSKFAFRLVRRMQRLLLNHEVSKKLTESGYKFRSGGYIKTAKRSLGLGGHIHFDIPYSRVSIESAKIVALNRFTCILEGLDILPKTESSYRHRYSGIEIIRCANESDRLEYRNMCSWLHSPVTAQLCLTGAKLAIVHPETVTLTMDLRTWFESFKEKDRDAARVVEKIFEPKLKLEARLDLDLQDTWQSLKKLDMGGL